MAQLAFQTPVTAENQDGDNNIADMFLSTVKRMVQGLGRKKRSSKLPPCRFGPTGTKMVEEALVATLSAAEHDTPAPRTRKGRHTLL